MLDELEDLKESKTFIDEVKEIDEEDLYPFPTSSGEATTKRFLGMTPAQLFVISIEFFFMILIFGVFFMVVTEKMNFVF